MSLSYRLKRIVDFVPIDAHFIADIGADHGLVTLELASTRKDAKFFASDNKKGPFSRLEKTLYPYNNIILSLSSGLDELPSEVDTVIIAGMGGDLIKSILEQGKVHLSHINYLILSPHNEADLVRKYLYENGFVLEKEDFIKDDSIYYSILLFKKGNGKLTNKEEKYGPFILKEKNEIFIEFINKEIKRNELIVNKINDEKRVEEINKYLKELKEL